MNAKSELNQELLNSVEHKLETIDPTLFRDAFLDIKTSKRIFLNLLKRAWKKSKGETVAFVLLTPSAFLTVKRQGFLTKYHEKFVELNHKFKKKLVGTKKEKERVFLKAFIELNDIAIEMTPCLLENRERRKEEARLEESFIQNPTRETLLRLWSSMRRSFELEIKIADLKKKKADIQDKIKEYSKKMTKLDKKDFEDFLRALLIDLVFSGIEKKILFISTPIEMLLKSGKIMNKIRGVFLFSQILRASAELTEERVNKLLEWFVTYNEKR